MRYQNQIEVEDLIIRTGEYSIIDVRTASEYGKGSVLGSINIPLFNEELASFIRKALRRRVFLPWI